MPEVKMQKDKKSKNMDVEVQKRRNVLMAINENIESKIVETYRFYGSIDV